MNDFRANGTQVQEQRQALFRALYRAAENFAGWTWRDSPAGLPVVGPGSQKNWEEWRAARATALRAQGHGSQAAYDISYREASFGLEAQERALICRLCAIECIDLFDGKELWKALSVAKKAAQVQRDILPTSRDWDAVVRLLRKYCEHIN